MGIHDGRQLEIRSTPLDRLEVDVLTQEGFDAFYNTEYTDFYERFLVIEEDHGDLMAHLTLEISEAHGGYIDVPNQIEDASITVSKCAFTVLTLGVGHNQAAHGDHLHDGIYAPIGDLANYVTLDTDQTITGKKTFTNAVFVDTQNFETTDQIIELNVNYPAAGGDFHSGLSIFDSIVRPGWPVGRNVYFTYDSANERFKHSVGVVGGASETFAYLSDLSGIGGSINHKGEVTCPGAGNYVTVNLTQAVPGYEVLLTVKRSNPDPATHTHDVGEVSYHKISDSEFRIYNSGSNDSDKIFWSVIE